MRRWNGWGVGLGLLLASLQVCQADSDAWKRGACVRVHRESTDQLFGFQPDEGYYAGRTWEAGLVLEKLHELRFQASLVRTGGTEENAKGVSGSEIRSLMEKARAEKQQLLAAGLLVKVPHNTRVVLLQSESQARIRYVLFPSLPEGTDGRLDNAWVYPVRVKDGPLKGRQLYAPASELAFTFADEGETVYVRGAGRRTGALAAFNQAICAWFYEAVEAGDREGAIAHARYGRMILLPCNTQGRLLKKEFMGDSSQYRLEILNGPHRGKLLWIDGDYTSLWPTGGW